MCVSQSAGNKYKQLTKKLTFFFCVCADFSWQQVYYTHVHEDVRKKNLEPVALAGVVVVVQQHHQNSTTTTPRGRLSRRWPRSLARWNLRRHAAIARSTRLCFSFLFFAKHFRFATTTTSSSPFVRRREISFEKVRRTIFHHHRWCVEPTTTLRRDPFIFWYSRRYKSKREEAAQQTQSMTTSLYSYSKYSEAESEVCATLRQTFIFLIVVTPSRCLLLPMCHLSAVLFHMYVCVSPNGSLPCTFRASWKFCFSFRPVFLLSASSTTTGLCIKKKRDKKGENHGRPFLPIFSCVCAPVYE